MLSQIQKDQAIQQDCELQSAGSCFGKMSLRKIFGSALLWLFIFAFYQIAAPNYLWLPDKGDTPYGADFLQEWVGARIFLEGDVKSLYNAELFQAKQHNQQELGFAWDTNSFFPPVYPPMHYFFFIPLALIPYRWAALVWLGILIAFAISAAHQIRNIALQNGSETFSSPSRRRALQVSIWFGIFLFPAVLASLTMGQKSVIWLLIVTSTWQLLLKKRDLTAGFVFGLLSIKPTLFFLLPLVLLSHGKIRFFVGASITVAALWGTGLCLLPAESWFGFLEGVKGSSNYPGMNGYRLDWSCNLLSLAYALPASFQVGFKQSVCVILAIYCLIGCFERRNYDVLSPEKLLLILCVTFLLSPHAYSYDMCVFLLPIFWIFAQQPRVGFVYYMLLTMAVAAAAMVLSILSLPVLPILLVGIVCELRLRKPSSQCGSEPSAASDFTHAKIAAVNPISG
jgi:hypothetical protein